MFCDLIMSWAQHFKHFWSSFLTRPLRSIKKSCWKRFKTLQFQKFKFCCCSSSSRDSQIYNHVFYFASQILVSRFTFFPGDTILCHDIHEIAKLFLKQNDIGTPRKESCLKVEYISCSLCAGNKQKQQDVNYDNFIVRHFLSCLSMV